MDIFPLYRYISRRVADKRRPNPAVSRYLRMFSPTLSLSLQRYIRSDPSPRPYYPLYGHNYAHFTADGHGYGLLRGISLLPHIPGPGGARYGEIAVAVLREYLSYSHGYYGGQLQHRRQRPKPSKTDR